MTAKVEEIDNRISSTKPKDEDIQSASCLTYGELVALNSKVKRISFRSHRLKQ